MINVVIDLSNNNSNVDLALIYKSGIIGIIHKATEGKTYIDVAYSQRCMASKKLGLLWGAYHFGNNIHSGQDQADHFLNVVKPGDKCLIALDLESNKGHSMSLDNAKAFVNRIHEKTGRWPGIYSGNYIKVLLGNKADPVLGNCWLWHPEYGPAPHIQATWDKWRLWQYTDGRKGPEPHEVQGIGACDRNRFDGDLSALQTFWCGA